MLPICTNTGCGTSYDWLLSFLSIVHGSKEKERDAASDQPHSRPDSQQEPHVRTEVSGEQVEQQRRVAEREEQAEEEGQQSLVEVCSAPEP